MNKKPQSIPVANKDHQYKKQKQVKKPQSDSSSSEEEEEEDSDKSLSENDSDDSSSDSEADSDSASSSDEDEGEEEDSEEDASSDSENDSDDSASSSEQDSEEETLKNIPKPNAKSTAAVKPAAKPVAETKPAANPTKETKSSKPATVKVESESEEADSDASSSSSSSSESEEADSDASSSSSESEEADSDASSSSSSSSESEEADSDVSSSSSSSSESEEADSDANSDASDYEYPTKGVKQVKNAPIAEKENTKNVQGKKAAAPALVALASNNRETPTHGSNEFTIFIGNLAYEVTEDMIAKEFEACGKVANVRLVMDKMTGRSKGIAYVDFTSKKDYDAALAMRGHSIMGRAIRVDAASSTKEFPNKPKSDPSPILFIGNLSYNTTEKGLEAAFSKFGPIMSVRIPTSYDKKPKGYAYVQFKSVESAKAAMEQPRFEMDGRIIRLDYDGQGGQGNAGQGRGGDNRRNNY